MISRLSYAGTAKKCTKKRDAPAKLLFCSLNLLLFWRSRCRRRRSFLRCLSVRRRCSERQLSIEPSCEMVTTTIKPVHLIFYMIKVWYPQLRFPQRKYLRVDLINSTAHTADASIELWCATVTTTVEMGQTRKTVPVAAMSWHAPMGSASITFGNVMVKMTVKMGRTSWIATPPLQVVTNKLLNKRRQQKSTVFKCQFV